MKVQQRSRGERWSSTYRNPTYELERDQENTAILIRDLRRTMWIGIAGVTIFAIVLTVTGSTEAGVNLLIIVGGPLLLIAAVAELLRAWFQRGQRT